MLLHNFIKSESNEDIDDSEWRPRDSANGNSERAFPLVTDNNEQYPRGWRTAGQDYGREKGEMVRRSITSLLQTEGLRRPINSGMRYNQYGHVFFDG